MIGLYQIDGKYPNLALMKLSAWFKSIGETITTFPLDFPLCNQVYASKIFQQSIPYNTAIPMIRGGTGWDDTSSLLNLDNDIEHIYPDYETFKCNYAMGYLTRGCIRKCKFCIVPIKEGKIRHNAHLSEFWKGQKFIRLLDNNLLSHPDWQGYCAELISSKAEIDFNQGIDARTLTEEKVITLKQIKIRGYLHTAWDHLKEKDSVLPGIELLKKHKIRFMVYVLTCFDSTIEEDLERINILRSMRIDPFVMQYKRISQQTQDIARWCNRKDIFWKVTFNEYKQKKALEV